jgi:transposase
VRVYAFSDVDAFVDAVLTELAAMAADGTRPTRSGPKLALTGAALRKAIMAIWCVGFCGMPWRAIGQLCDIPFGTLYTLFARWTRPGLWRRLLNRLIQAWRQACGDTPKPSAVIIDSRSCHSAPSCFGRGFQGRRMKSARQKRQHVLIIPGGMLATRAHADSGCSVTTHEVDSDLAQDGQITGRRSVPDAAVILPEGDIQHPMEPVFYGPMPSDRLNQHCRIITAA